jgi:diadenosine tetraphosphate (Ap4A) HIT family hydrolase
MCSPIFQCTTVVPQYTISLGEVIAMSNVSDCPFCSEDDAIVKNEHAYARFDKYPVNPGHVLVIPRRHVSSFFETSQSERREMLNLVDEMKSFLDRKYSPDGYNIGVNVGETAGQTVMHVHMHLIPRYKGDIPNPRGGVRGVIPAKQSY